MALGSEILAALAIPSLPSFRMAVDRQQHQALQSQRRINLLSEISSYGDNTALVTYQHMYSRVQALYQTANDSRNSLTRQDVERLEDLTVDYLGLCAVNLSLKQRKDRANDEVVAKRMASIQNQLQNTQLPEDEARQLRSVLAEYTEVANRARRLAVRRSALEATLMSLPDKMEEVYQLVITSPYASDMGGKLEESLSRLRLAEEVAAEFEAFDAFDTTSLKTTSAPPVNQAARHAASALKT
jgi:hypothetical protein